MVTKATGKSALDFARDALFEPLGIHEAKWPDDPQGLNRGWGDLQLHPRDMARIGHLFLNEGTWNGVQVVSKEWVEQATRHQVTAATDGTGYGYQWWVLNGAFAGPYEARGRGGQAITVWPDKDIVAVFTGHGGDDVRGEVALLLAAALKSDEPLPPNPDASARLAAAIATATEPPAAQPVPPLPPTAAQVTGNVYRLSANQLDLRCFSLAFVSPSNVSLHLTIGSARFDFPVGMDGVPRFSESGPTDIPVGIARAWVEPGAFLVHYDEVAGPNHLVIRSDFVGDPEAVAMEITDPSGYFPAESVAGAVVPSCT
ncbi:MAG: serine hydrolase [Polyangiales bacterium]